LKSFSSSQAAYAASLPVIFGATNWNAWRRIMSVAFSTGNEPPIVYSTHGRIL